MISLVAIVAAFQAPPMSSKERQMRAAHLPSIMEDLFRPVGTERAPAPARLLSGRLPADLQRGALLKNGPNAQPFGEASGGWLDGDGLVHCIVLPPDEESREPTFSRTFLRTQGFAKEEAGKAHRWHTGGAGRRNFLWRWRRTLWSPRSHRRTRPTRPSCGLTTDVLALMEQCSDGAFGGTQWRGAGGARHARL